MSEYAIYDGFFQGFKQQENFIPCFVSCKKKIYSLRTFKMLNPNILEVQLPFEPSCPSVGWSVGWFVGLSFCHKFLPGREVSLSCSYLSTC